MMRITKVGVQGGGGGGRKKINKQKFDVKTLQSGAFIIDQQQWCIAIGKYPRVRDVIP